DFDAERCLTTSGRDGFGHGDRSHGHPGDPTQETEPNRGASHGGNYPTNARGRRPGGRHAGVSVTCPGGGKVATRCWESRPSRMNQRAESLGRMWGLSAKARPGAVDKDRSSTEENALWLQRKCVSHGGK